MEDEAKWEDITDNIIFRVEILDIDNLRSDKSRSTTSYKHKSVNICSCRKS